MRFHSARYLLLVVSLVGGCHPVAPSSPSHSNVVVAAPPSPPSRWLGLIGEYGPDDAVRIVLERDGALALYRGASETPLDERGANEFALRGQSGALAPISFVVDAAGRATHLRFSGTSLDRRRIGPESGDQLLVVPVRPLRELRREALAASPPNESGPFLPSDLVELVRLDSTIHLEIRYATSNNLFGTPFYTQARAFLQRPAAEALVRANAELRALGYGLLVHDGYRPWSVTKMFWEAAPEDKRIFVADPAQGSKHNRGAAIDLTLYDRTTGRAVEMPSTYDETTDRAYADYPGGTSRQRWHRALLRRAMEAQRFAVNPREWWHFDYADWRRYPIGNVEFERLGR
ncbi:MAG: M15 family metallopeptidase [Gemmatimonadaceae bacterium]|nr:M15 family metallopeptidase [Gemmatimonadaceae bacterium]